MNADRVPRRVVLLALAAACAFVGCDTHGGASTAQASVKTPAKWPRNGSAEHPLEVMLIPADGGTEDGTKSDFLPLFNAITKTEGLHFNVRVGQSYGAVVEAMANGQVDVGFFGPVSYLQAKKRAGAELLNRAIWYSTRGFDKPYPGDARVLLPAEVHGDRLAAFPSPK